jgi:hypothetical protein
MKFFYLFSLAFLMVNYSYSQNTTEEEYMYLLRGYAKGLKKGKDIKEGFRAQDQGMYNLGAYTFRFLDIYRFDDTQAGTVIMANSKITGRDYNYVIPLPGNKCYQKLYLHFMNHMSRLDKSMTTAFFGAYTQYLGFKTLSSVQDKDKDK